MNETLMARLGLDTTGFKSGLKSAHSSFQSFAGQLGIGLSIAGLAGASREIIEYGSRIQDMAIRFNVGTTALQQFGNAAELNGSSLEGMAKGFNKLAISQSQALGGNEKIAAAFASLGITLDDLRSLSPEELMLKLGKSSMNAADLVKLLGKSALELRPTLAGLADGTIELGEAIDSDLIRKLDEADDALRSFWQGVRIYGASVLVQIADEIKFIVTGITGMFSGMREVALAEGRAIAAALALNFDEVRKQAAVAAAALQKIKDSAFGSGKDGGAPASGGSRHSDATEGAENSPAQRRATERAEQKERERHQLNLKELQGGAHTGRWLTGGTVGGGTFSGTYQQSTGTMQMQYAAQQARLVEELEGRAKRLRLLGMNDMGTGESADTLMSRADSIRQTLPIKESEKEVGIYSKAFKESLTETNQKLDALIENTE